MTPKIIAFVPDIMDRSRFPKIADVTFVSTAEELLQAGDQADIAIADLNRSGAYEALMAVTGAKQRIGFTNHENTELLEQSKKAGIDAMARSRFFSRIALIVTGSQA